MAQKTAARGRPKGTGVDDAGALMAIADIMAANPGTTVKIDAAYVQKHVGDLSRNTDLSRFIL